MSKFLSASGHITDKGLIHLKGIRELDLSENFRITDDGLIHLEGIQKLYLNSGTLVTNYGLFYLRGIKTLHLKHNTNITNSGLFYLKGIKKLVICGYGISRDGIKHLKDIEVLHVKYMTPVEIFIDLKNIKTLTIKNKPITKQHLETIEYYENNTIARWYNYVRQRFV